MIGYIYKIIYKPLNQVIYIGKTTKTIELRYKRHLIGNTLFDKFLRFKGIENFILDCVEKIELDTTKGDLIAKLDEAEKYWIEYYCTFEYGLNYTKGGGGSLGMCGELNPMYGRKHSKESNEANRKAHLGRKNPKLAERNKIYSYNRGKKRITLENGKHKYI